jgi:protein SCO1
MSKKYKKYLIIALMLLGPGSILVFLSKANHQFKYLPYYGIKQDTVVTRNGIDEIDTVYHTIPPFEFINQDGNLVTQNDYKDKIVVVDFFFATCQSICPVMTKQMSTLLWKLEDDAYKDVKFLSHTVNPQNDTPQVLKKYGEKYKADFSRWTFVTGEKEKIYQQGFTGYLLSTQEDSTALGGFLHSPLFVLIDKQQHIRGFYDGTVTKEVDDLVIDIKMLLKEEKTEKKKAEKLADKNGK